VTIKVISKYRFPINEAEVEILAKLPISLHLIRLIETYDEDRKFYIITNYVKGDELSSWQAKEVSTSFLYALAGQMLETLQLIHNVGIVHRDIKLENILVDAILH
jgi:serine/threonine protein kinase